MPRNMLIACAVLLALGPISALATAPPALSATAQAIMQDEHVDSLKVMARSCGARLTGQAWQLSMQVDFYPQKLAARAAVELSELLEQVTTELTATQETVGQLERYLRWYPETDWQQRFGATGFYDELGQVKQSLDLYECLVCYYQAYTTDSTDADYADANNSEPADRADNLVQCLKTITDFAGRNRPPALTLWQIRLMRRLGRENPDHLSQARRLITDILLTKPPTRMQFDVRFEGLRCAADAVKLDRGNLGRQIQTLKKWVNANQNQLPNYPDILLQLALFEIKSYPQANRHAMLGNLAQQFESLAQPINEILAVYLEDDLAQAADPKRVLAGLSTDEMLTLVRHWQRADPPNWAGALDICRRLLQSRPASDIDYGEALYQAGSCHQQLAQQMTELGASEAGATEHMIAAIEYWHRLAREMPGWSSPSDRQQINAEQTATQAASLVCRLFATDRHQFGDLSCAVLGTLVGDIDPNQSGAVPVGPLAQTASARRYRYHYGCVLQAVGRYAQATAMYAAVPADDPEKAAADYYTVVCQLEQNDTPALRQRCMGKLTELVQSYERQPNQKMVRPLAGKAVLLLAQLNLEAPGGQAQPCLNVLDRYGQLWASDPVDRADRAAALLLRTQAYRQLGQTESALKALADEPITATSDQSLLTVCLNVLADQRATLMTLHSNNQRAQLAQALALSLPLARGLYESAGADRVDGLGLGPVAARSYLELLSLAAANTAECRPANGQPDNDVVSPLGHTLPPLDELIAAGQSVLEHLAGQADQPMSLWQVRCEAMLAWARGDWADSRGNWYLIRRATENRNDHDMSYYWWESRYFGLCCLLRQGDADQVAHAIDVLIRSRSDYDGPWLDRIAALRQTALATSTSGP